jgi:crotonobetainyl-CoA:carnitine CoA-transferase CaiB-like acyl-CoA transferase
MKARFESHARRIAELDAVFQGRTLDEWREALGGMEGPWAPVQRARELLSVPQALEIGDVKQVVAPPVLTRGPEWGEHADEVLQGELGLPMDELLEYEAKGVIR